MTIRILVVDDELGRLAYRREEFLARWNFFPADEVDALEFVFITSQHRFEDRIENDASLAVDFVSEASESWALVLLDMQFDHGPLLHGEPIEADAQFGLSIHTALEQRFPDLPVVHFTAQAQQDLRRQDSHYLSKLDGTPDDLRLALVELGRVSPQDKRRLLQIPSDTVMASAAMLAVYADVYRRARSATPLLIRGETGTGKEHLARYFHAVSPHAAGALVALQVSSIPAELYESELFGHEKGAFTGADTAREGAFGRAAGGTLFLDEIGPLPQSLQAKLLRALGDRVYRKLGGKSDLELRCGVVAATQDDLEASGFRQDLLARFGVVTVPPLRERPEDVSPLAEYFLTSAQQRSGKRGIVLSREAKDALARATFTDNARGVGKVIEQAVLRLSSNSVIQAWHLGLSDRVDASARIEANSSEIAAPVQTGNETLKPEVESPPNEWLDALRTAKVIPQPDALRGLLEQCETSLGAIRLEIALAALQCCRHPVSGKVRVLPAMQLITANAAMSPVQARRKLNDILGRNQRDSLALNDLESTLNQRYGMVAHTGRGELLESA